MIKIGDIKKVVKLILLTGYIKNVEPLSLFLVGKSGTGKTEILKHYKSPRIKFLTDLSYMGLLKILKEKRCIKHIVLPDFIKITMKKRATSDNLISILNAMVEEGIGHISLYNFDCDFKDRKCGLITATTKASLSQKFKGWEKIGFISRMIFCSYSYSKETTKEIMNYINSEQFLSHKFEKIEGFKDIIVESPKKLNSELNIACNSKFRTLKQLQALTKAHALLSGRSKINKEDIKEVIRLSQTYLNLNYTQL